MSKSRTEISEFLLIEIDKKINDYDNFILSIGDDVSYDHRDTGSFYDIKGEIFSRLNEISELKKYYNVSVHIGQDPE